MIHNFEFESSKSNMVKRAVQFIFQRLDESIIFILFKICLVTYRKWIHLTTKNSTEKEKYIYCFFSVEFDSAALFSPLN